MYDLIIIGSGPAGLGAALYARRAGLSVLALETLPMSGGQIVNTEQVDNYLGIPGIGGFELGQQFRSHVDRLGAQFALACVSGVTDGGRVKTVHTDHGDYEAKSLILATGATHKKLGVPGEEAFAGMGVSYCATCDGAFFRNRDVAVIGGGDVAVEDAAFLAKLCRKVYLVHRRDELRAAKILQDALFALPNVELVWNSQLTAIEGKDTVEGVVVTDKLTLEERRISVSGVFIAVGIVPQSGPFERLVRCDEAGYVIAGEDCATSVPGIFAAGDLRTKRLRQVITAVADGANAVVGVQDYLRSIR